MNDELYQRVFNEIDTEIACLICAQDALKEACKHSPRTIDQQIRDAMKLIAGRLIDLEVDRARLVEEQNQATQIQIPSRVTKGGQELIFPSEFLGN